MVAKPAMILDPFFRLNTNGHKRTCASEMAQETWLIHIPLVIHFLVPSGYFT